MSLHDIEPLYPRDPFDQYQLIRDEQASIAQIIGENLALDAQADLTYWLDRCRQLAAWHLTLGRLIQARGEAARQRLESR